MVYLVPFSLLLRATIDKTLFNVIYGVKYPRASVLIFLSTIIAITLTLRVRRSSRFWPVPFLLVKRKDNQVEAVFKGRVRNGPVFLKLKSTTYCFYNCAKLKVWKTFLYWYKSILFALEKHNGTKVNHSINPPLSLSWIYKDLTQHIP